MSPQAHKYRHIHIHTYTTQHMHMRIHTTQHPHIHLPIHHFAVMSPSHMHTLSQGPKEFTNELVLT